MVEVDWFKVDPSRNGDVLKLVVKDFYVNITQEVASNVRMKVTSADVTEGTSIIISLSLLRNQTADNDTNLTFEYRVTVRQDVQQRNVALELLEIFSRFGNSHLNFISSKFESFLAQSAQTISEWFCPNSNETIIGQFEHLS